MKILALEAATESCSVALLDGDELIDEFKIAPRQQTKLLLPMVERVLATAGVTLTQLDVVAFGCGPGAFTGVRVAAAMTQGLAYAADLPVAAISTLAAMAQGAWRETQSKRLLPALDARMGELYIGAYQLGAEGLMEPVMDDQLSKPDLIQYLPRGKDGEAAVDWYGVGSGYLYHENITVQFPQLSHWELNYYPQARDIADLAVTVIKNGGLVSAEQALPVYLRDSVAWKKSNL